MEVSGEEDPEAVYIGQPRRGEQTRDRLPLSPGQLLHWNFSGRGEPDDSVLVVRCCRKKLYFTRCDFIQLMFLLLCVVLMVLLILGLYLGL
jgi:hypothetical protein